jgi:hypothetical protein
MSATFADERFGVRTDTPAEALGRALNADLTRPLAFALLAIVFAISRAPFLNISYGTDPDAWRIALTGHWLWDHGEYYPSRLPGYPIPEFASALVIKGGYLATNTLTALVSLLGVWYFAKIVNRLALPNRALLVVAFAFTPLLWINSMTTMDYMYAVTFLLGSYYFTLNRNAFLAGIFMGLAIGSRMTSVLFLLPMVLYMVRDGQRHELRNYIVMMLAVSLAAWAIVYWTYGLSMFNAYGAEVWYLNVLRLLAKDTLGLLGSMAILVAVALSLPRLKSLPHDALHDKHVTTWLLIIAITFVTFFQLPHEAAYLLPVYPFGLMLLARYLHRWVLLGAVSVVLLAGWVDLTTPGEDISIGDVTELRVGKGLLLSNRDTMLAQNSFVEDLGALEIPEFTVVSTGFVYPQFAVTNRDRFEVGIIELDRSSISQLSDSGQTKDPTRAVLYVWLLDWDRFQDFGRQGYKFMYTLDAGRSTNALYGYRPGLYGAQPIDLGRGPTGGSGAARTDR